MKLRDFDFLLSPAQIAQQPADQRDAARLLWLDRRAGGIKHYTFRALPDLLIPGDLLVLNDTRVVAARLHMRKATNEANLEVLLAGEGPQPGEWKALLRPSRRIRPGDRLHLPGETGYFEVLEKGEFGLCRLQARFDSSVHQLMEVHGETPLPPYIKRSRASIRAGQDQQRYQTVYARASGSIAAPTAGLHFTDAVFAALREKGIELCFLTLHVGLSTFQPIRVDEIERHKLPPERMFVSPDAARQIQQARDEGRRVIAVGTTTTRALESSAALHQGEVVAGDFWADLYIYPPYDFKVVRGLITNFHLPQSSLLVLVAAFAGRESLLSGYQEAIGLGYRFYSYGDCMAIL